MCALAEMGAPSNVGDLKKPKKKSPMRSSFAPGESGLIHTQKVCPSTVSTAKATNAFLASEFDTLKSEFFTFTPQRNTQVRPVFLLNASR